MYNCLYNNTSKHLKIDFMYPIHKLYYKHLYKLFTKHNQ
jgi:hypothetical protein